jgi:hypothetical protein
MNIFILDTDPVRAAEMQCDKHVVKMVSEAAQLLCTVFDPDTTPWKHTHYNHPCAKWARESKENFNWLVRHGLALAYEYTYRYDKVHKAQVVIEWCVEQSRHIDWKGVEQTPFVQTMPDQYRLTDTVTAYRNFYIGEKSRFAKWNKTRPAPNWYINGMERRDKDEETKTQI